MAVSPTRKFFVGGNWKCFGTSSSCVELATKVKNGQLPDKSIVEVVVAPPFVYLEKTNSVLEGSDIKVAAQNCWHVDKGAFTGEVSAAMLKDIGLDWVILGHSERRHESDELIAKKCSAAIKNGLSVILCVGETLSQRESNSTEQVIKHQLESVKNHITDWSSVVIAYEPVWAIGTGKVATPQQAQEVHAYLRQWLHDQISPEVAQQTRIIYGGSVKPENCVELSKKKDIDGFLVGGCSLVPEQFLAIVGSANDALKKEDHSHL